MGQAGINRDHRNTLCCDSRGLAPITRTSSSMKSLLFLARSSLVGSFSGDPGPRPCLQKPRVLQDTLEREFVSISTSSFLHFAFYTSSTTRTDLRFS